MPSQLESVACMDHISEPLLRKGGATSQSDTLCENLAPPSAMQGLPVVQSIQHVQRSSCSSSCKVPNTSVTRCAEEHASLQHFPVLQHHQILTTYA